MNVLQNLTELYNHLPLDSTYRVVAKGILENLDKMQGNYTIYDIADLTDSSRTTVWRMVQKMGYDNFTDFRLALKTAVSQYNYFNRMFPEGKGRDAKGVLELAKAQIHQAADVLSQGCSPELLEDLVRQLHLAKKVRFYFPFRLPMIYSLQQNLAMSGKDTTYICLLPEMLEDVESLDENSILCISCIEFAETMDMMAVFQKARDKGAYVWLIGSENSRYRHLADQLIMDEKSDVLSWITAIDVLFLAISEHYRAVYIDHSED